MNNEQNLRHDMTFNNKRESNHLNIDECQNKNTDVSFDEDNRVFNQNPEEINEVKQQIFGNIKITLDKIVIYNVCSKI